MPAWALSLRDASQQRSELPFTEGEQGLAWGVLRHLPHESSPPPHDPQVRYAGPRCGGGYTGSRNQDPRLSSRVRSVHSWVFESDSLCLTPDSATLWLCDLRQVIEPLRDSSPRYKTGMMIKMDLTSKSCCLDSTTSWWSVHNNTCHAARAQQWQFLPLLNSLCLIAWPLKNVTTHSLHAQKRPGAKHW